MQKEFSSSASWNSAAVSGLIMAAATIVLVLIEGLAGKMTGVAGGLVSFVVLMAKLVACISLFRWLMAKFKKDYQDVDYNRLKKYGIKIALFSSILVAAFSLIQMLMTDPQALAEQMQAAMASYMSQMDSNMESAMEQMSGKMPAISFFSNLFYCFIWGWALSLIFAKSLSPMDPFGDTTAKPDDTSKTPDSNEGSSNTDNN